MHNQNSDTNFLGYKEIKHEALLQKIATACGKIAPLWPLDRFVAVNPYMGLADQKFSEVASQLSRLNGIHTTLPISFYLEQIKNERITKADLHAALSRHESDLQVDNFIHQLYEIHDEKFDEPLIRDVGFIASQVKGKDWSRFVVSRISNWAAAHFDEGQAAWKAGTRELSVFDSWRVEALLDRSPELTGLSGFRKHVEKVPKNAVNAIHWSLEQLEVPVDGIGVYLHKLLVRSGGWAAHAARMDWDANLAGQKTTHLQEFLAVLVSWEACLYLSIHSPELNKRWSEACRLMVLQDQTAMEGSLTQRLILQEAFDHSQQRMLIETINSQEAGNEKTEVSAQAIFCIDVRSEVFRRNLETVDPTIDTLGFAGFFGFPVSFLPIGKDDIEANCPVLIPNGPVVQEIAGEESNTVRINKQRRISQQMKYLWKSFKSGAVSCFSFVSPLGISFLPKLFSDSFGITRPVPDPRTFGMGKDSILETEVAFTSDIDFETKVGMAKNALSAMSLTKDFAPYVLIVGHGSTTVNNPHATGLDCGACGGHTGEANAKIAAAVLNDQEVREALKKEGIDIPEKTIFLACLHNTTTDEISIYNAKNQESKEEFRKLVSSLELAGKSARNERSHRMSLNKGANIDKQVLFRSKDWSQVRPEWGLAGCHSFVVAPRKRTSALNLGGRSFLHSYDWEQDEGFGILEVIMTAPMVVTSWINLQYYASTVDNRAFGSGNKTLHNVTSGIGVLEGYSGDLRTGLPMQSIFDGENFQHEPLRLNVMIEAPVEAMTIILERHESVRNLVDNGWIYLFAINDNGKVSHRYKGGLKWEKLLK